MVRQFKHHEKKYAPTTHPRTLQKANDMQTPPKGRPPLLQIRWRPPRTRGDGTVPPPTDGLQKVQRSVRWAPPAGAQALAAGPGQRPDAQEDRVGGAGQAVAPGDPEAEPRAGGGPVARGARGDRVGVLSAAAGGYHGADGDGGEYQDCTFFPFLLPFEVLCEWRRC